MGLMGRPGPVSTIMGSSPAMARIRVLKSTAAFKGSVPFTQSAGCVVRIADVTRIVTSGESTAGIPLTAHFRRPFGYPQADCAMLESGLGESRFASVVSPIAG